MLCQRILLVVLVLISIHYFGSLASTATCNTDADCGNNRGICTEVNSTKYCSCKSGFGGDTCSVVPQETCASQYGSVNSTIASFNASASMQYFFPNLTLQVETNLEETSWVDPWNLPNATLNVEPFSLETTIVFGNGSFPQCDFPGVLWSKQGAQSGNCMDVYSSSLSWTTAKSLCGFQDVYGNRTFTQTIKVSRRYKLPSIRDTELSRTESTTRVLQVIFPTEVDVGTSSIQVNGAADLLAAITNIDFDPAASPEKWTVSFVTSVQAPFKLENPLVIGASGAIQSNDRFLVASETMMDLQPCVNNSRDCAQSVSLSFGKGTAVDACTALSGNVVVVFSLTCSEGLNGACPLVGNETVQVTLMLNTGDACPVTEQIQFTTTTLSGFSDAALSVPRRSFLNSDTAFFGGVIEATQAQIASRSVKPGSVCAQLSSGGACMPLNYTVASATNGKDPVFYVAFTHPTNQAVFSSGSATADYVVKATVLVSFTDMKRSITHYPNQDVQLAASLTVVPATSDSDPEHVSTSAVLAANLLCVVFFASVSLFSL